MIAEKQTPSDYTSAHGDVWYVVESDKKALSNFKYVFDVWVGGAQVARIKVYPEPEYGLGLFNAGQIVRSYLTNHYFNGHEDMYDTYSADGRLWKAVEVKYGEEYLDTDGSTVLDVAVLTAATIKVYNYYNDILYRRLENALAPLANNYLSTAPTTREVEKGDSLYLLYWNEAAQPLTVTVSTFNAAGEPNGQEDFPVADALELVSFNFGPAGIYGMNPDLLNDSVAAYTVTVANGTTTVERYFRMTCNPKYPTYALHFLNQWGGYDSMHFRYISKRRGEREQKTYSRRNYTYDSTGALRYSDINGVMRGSTQVYASRYTHKYKLASGFLTDAEFRWLYQLIVSPLVWLELKKSQYIITQEGEFIFTQDGLPWVTEYGQTFFYPVQLTDNTYEFKTRNADKLNGLEVDFTILEQYNAQFA